MCSWLLVCLGYILMWHHLKLQEYPYTLVVSPATWIAREIDTWQSTIQCEGAQLLARLTYKRQMSSPGIKKGSSLVLTLSTTYIYSIDLNVGVHPGGP